MFSAKHDKTYRYKVVWVVSVLSVVSVVSVLSLVSLLSLVRVAGCHCRQDQL